jgi:hypothetical protein
MAQAPSTPAVEAFVHAASLHGKAATPPKTPAQVLEEVLLGRFASDVRNGRTVISFSEGGTQTSWTLPDGLSPMEIMQLAHEALQWLAAQPDPDNPVFGNRVTRLRCAFNRALV